MSRKKCRDIYGLINKGARNRGRARADKRVPSVPAIEAKIFELKLCPPMALWLLSRASGDFGTSPFFEQLPGESLLTRISVCGVRGSKHNSASINKFAVGLGGWPQLT